MPHNPEDMSYLMIELSLALRELAHNMSNLAVALENDYLQQASPLNDATRQSAVEVIDKAKAR
ncbi:MAG TPA: hypothetical protein VNX00_01740 [Herbaspirillum sp.]|jgi:hypothetical protein|nr:hypothetical protein [Herbaspirillum sp.]